MCTATCAQLHKRAEKITATLMERGGLNTGDNVVLLYPPGEHTAHSTAAPTPSIADGCLSLIVPINMAVIVVDQAYVGLPPLQALT